MAKLFTLPSVAMVAVVGIGAGIHLGNGAANSINPFYSTPLPSRSYASVSPAGTGGLHPISLSEAETRQTLGGACVGCRTYAEEYVPGSSLEQQQMPDGYYAASVGAPRGYRAAYVDFSEPAREPDSERTDIERYASYPVTHTEGELREIEDHHAEQARQAIAAREQAEALRDAEEKSVPRGTEQLIY